MTTFGSLYSQYYDLLYNDKDYTSEVDYVDSIIKNYCPSGKTILDLGCGTGRHAELFCDRGFIVHGVDISNDMLQIAIKRTRGRENQLNFSCSRIQDLKLNQQFDVINSLFHVISYQTSDEDLINAFLVTKKHLVENGIFIFDFWYGPAVLSDLPLTRVKRFENSNIKVTRIAEPIIHVDKNIVEVKYDIFIENKKEKYITEIKETHNMRYFFDKELELICNQIGFSILQKYEWMSKKKPDLKSWNVVWIVKK